jgi:MinD-like ATPase involved in chromosome partitioning or flagellar assembly
MGGDTSAPGQQMPPPAPGPRWGNPEPPRHQAPPLPQHPAQPASQRPPAREDWPAGPGPGGEPRQWNDQSIAPGHAGSWSYVDSIRPDELVPTRKIPPRKGWRKVVYKSTFGLINFGQSPDERRLAELETKIRSLLRGRYKIGVLGKGGVGKTTIAAGVGSIFAELRQDDRVVAIDADTAFGKLGLRVDPNAKGSYWELAADQQLHTFADVRSRVGNNPAGLFVLAGESSTARRRVLDPQIYREATNRLDNHFTLSIIDCGSTMDAAVTREVLRDLDALIVVSSMWVDGASAAAQTMELLANSGHTGLLHRTVVVLNDSDGHADKRTREVLHEQFSQRGQLVVEVPFDRHLRPAGVIDVQNQVDKTTRRRFIEIAAAIAEHFPATSDNARGRR